MLRHGFSLIIICGVVVSNVILAAIDRSNLSVLVTTTKQIHEGARVQQKCEKRQGNTGAKLGQPASFL